MSEYREYDNAPNLKDNIGRRFELLSIGQTKKYVLYYDVRDGYYGVNGEDKMFLRTDYNGVAEVYVSDTFHWIEPPLPTASEISNPSYYGGSDNPYEAIKVINAHDLNFCLGNSLKYILRAGKKDSETRLKDLQKAIDYLQFEIQKV